MIISVTSSNSPIYMTCLSGRTRTRQPLSLLIPYLLYASLKVHDLDSLLSTKTCLKGSPFLKRDGGKSAISTSSLLALCTTRISNTSWGVIARSPRRRRNAPGSSSTWLTFSRRRSCSGCDIMPAKTTIRYRPSLGNDFPKSTDSPFACLSTVCEGRRLPTRIPGAKYCLETIKPPCLATSNPASYSIAVVLENGRLSRSCWYVPWAEKFAPTGDSSDKALSKATSCLVVSPRSSSYVFKIERGEIPLTTCAIFHPRLYAERC